MMNAIYISNNERPCLAIFDNDEDYNKAVNFINGYYLHKAPVVRTKKDPNAFPCDRWETIEYEETLEKPYFSIYGVIDILDRDYGAVVIDLNSDFRGNNYTDNVLIWKGHLLLFESKSELQKAPLEAASVDEFVQHCILNKVGLEGVYNLEEM